MDCSCYWVVGLCFAVGDKPRLAHVFGITARADIVVSDERAASGKHSLKITDSDEERPAYQPHLVYGFTDIVLERGTGRLTFDLWRGPRAQMAIEWRDDALPYRIGPRIAVAADGGLTAADRPITTLPEGQWLHFEMTAQVGRESNGRWELRVSSGGQPIAQADNLVCDPDMGMLAWLGFCSTACEETVQHLDNIRFDEVPAEEVARHQREQTMRHLFFAGGPGVPHRHEPVSPVRR